jgi:endogenous inhibitor of DNA gyrase (YacG/DUF329 family)
LLRFARNDGDQGRTRFMHRATRNRGGDVTRRRELTVACPACRQPAVYGPGNRWRPFCSERCRRIDLGAWASEDYRVPAQSPPEHGGDEPAEPPRPH